MMMAIQHTGLVYQIIRREPGEGTGEEKIQTSDGTWWDSVAYLPAKGTGDRQGISFYDNVYEI